MFTLVVQDDPKEEKKMFLFQTYTFPNCFLFFKFACDYRSSIR